MVDVSQTGPNGQTFAEQLLDAQGVSVLPGVGFGRSTANYVRLSLAQPIIQLRPALDRLASFCQAQTHTAD